MKRIDLLPPALALLCALAASACDNPRVQEQTHQAGEAIKAAGKETGEAVTAAGDVAVEKTKAAVEQAGGAIQQAGEDAKESARQAGKDLTAAAEKAGDTAQKKIEAAGDTAKKRIEDAAVTASIKAKLIANADVKAVSIDVDTVGGRVTLRGTVKTAAQRDEAERIARATEGVVSVDNRIVVGSK
ncbi:MAG TPA: BON domain-containing protein [Thermoanaerobaculia bacterium]|nr:BON domain-containing protein [Thermoanaerobaculia bacterium]